MVYDQRRSSVQSRPENNSDHSDMVMPQTATEKLSKRAETIRKAQTNHFVHSTPKDPSDAD